MATFSPALAQPLPPATAEQNIPIMTSSVGAEAAVEVGGNAPTLADQAAAGTAEASDSVSPSKWSFEWDELFESILAHHDQEYPDLLENVASMFSARDLEEATPSTAPIMTYTAGAEADLGEGGNALMLSDQVASGIAEARASVSISQWCFEEDKLFESVAAYHDQNPADLWENVGYMFSGRELEEARKHYKMLEGDITADKADRNELERPCWSPARTPDSIGCAKGKKKTASSKTSLERRRGINWTEEEHKLFLLGLEMYGKGDWKSISRYSVISRTPTQVASHAQKHFNRQNSINENKQRLFNGGVQ